MGASRLLMPEYWRGVQELTGPLVIDAVPESRLFLGRGIDPRDK